MSNLIPTVGDQLPVYASEGDAGADLRSAVDIQLWGGITHMVSTGVSIALPDGFAGFILPRSGLAAKHGITVLNSPGLIDSKYRGELKVLLHNTTGKTYEVKKGDRIAQLVIMPVVTAIFQPVDALPESGRGHGGFGSTGY